MYTNNHMYTNTNVTNVYLKTSSCEVIVTTATQNSLSTSTAQLHATSPKDPLPRGAPKGNQSHSGEQQVMPSDAVGCCQMLSDAVGCCQMSLILHHSPRNQQLLSMISLVSVVRNDDSSTVNVGRVSIAGHGRHLACLL